MLTLQEQLILSRVTVYIVLAEGNDRDDLPLKASNLFSWDDTSANKWWWGKQNLQSYCYTN